MKKRNNGSRIRYLKSDNTISSSPSTKSEGNVLAKSNRNIPEWQKRPWTLNPTNKNVFKEIKCIETTFDSGSVHRPRLNTPRDFRIIYDTAEEVSKAKRLGSAHSRSVTPSRCGSSMSMRSVDFSIAGRQETYYEEMKNVYDSTKEQKRREKSFIDRYTSVRANYIKDKLREQKAQEKKKIEEQNRILRELKRNRTRFKKETYHRVETQYVTPKLLEHEKLDREKYGLPENVRADFKLKLRKPRQWSPIKDVLKTEVPRFKSIGIEKHSKHLYGVTYPTIDKTLRPPAFGRQSRQSIRDRSGSQRSEKSTQSLHQTKSNALRSQRIDNRNRAIQTRHITKPTTTVY